MNELFSKEFDSDENDDEYVPAKKELLQVEKESFQPEVKKVKTSNIDELWNKLKSANNKPVLPKSETVVSSIDEQSKKNREEKVISKDAQSTENEIQIAMEKLKKQQQEKVKDVVMFAGQKFEYDKKVDAKALDKLNKKQTHKGLDNICDLISNKKNISTIDKTKKDWDNLVKKNNIEKELIANRKDGYLGKKHFIDEMNSIVQEKNKRDIKKAKFAYENKITK